MRIHILTTLLLILISSRAFAEDPIKITPDQDHGVCPRRGWQPFGVGERAGQEYLDRDDDEREGLLFPFHITRRLHRDHLLMPWF